MELKTNHSEMMIFGLIYVVVSLLSLFLFIGYTAGIQVPKIFTFNENAISLLFISIVNLASAWGLLYRKKYMWSATMMFMFVIIIGGIMDLFFTDVFKYVSIVLATICALYLFSTPAREWYMVL